MLQRSCWRCGWPTSCGTGPASPSKFASRRTAVHCAASGNLQVRDALRAEEGQHAAAAAVGLPVVKHALSAGEAHTCIADTMHRVWHSRARVRATETRKRRTHRVLACVRQSHQHRALLDDEPLVAAQAQASSAVAAGPARHEDTSRRCGAAGAVVHRLLDRARAADLVSISRGKAGKEFAALWAVYTGPIKAFAGQAKRPDLAVCVASGVVDICVDVVVAFAAAGLEGLRDANPGMLCVALGYLSVCGTQPGCETKIRSAATAIAFCLENSLDFMEKLSVTTGSMAAKVCCSVFGRDEGGSEFAFTRHHIDIIRAQV